MDACIHRPIFNSFWWYWHLYVRVQKHDFESAATTADYTHDAEYSGIGSRQINWFVRKSWQGWDIRQILMLQITRMAQAAVRWADAWCGLQQGGVRHVAKYCAVAWAHNFAFRQNATMKMDCSTGLDFTIMHKLVSMVANSGLDWWHKPSPESHEVDRKYRHDIFWDSICRTSLHNLYLFCED